MKINVLSGKGGVGKSTVASSIASILAKRHEVVAVDCDVDTPNLGLFFGFREEDFDRREVKTSEKAVLVPEECTKCGKCVETCVFSAISWEGKPVIDRFLCEGCGACKIACLSNAIRLVEARNGWIGHASKGRMAVVGGQLKPGESESGIVVALVKQLAEDIAAEKGAETVIIDSAAGIGCPVIASVKGSDYVIAVTEPTPPALADLKRALEVVEHFRIPYGIVVNKSDLNPQMTRKVKAFAEKSGAEVLAEIPYDKRFIEALVRLEPAVSYDRKLEPLFAEILGKVLKSA